MAKRRLASVALLNHKYRITFINFVKQTLKKVSKNPGQIKDFAGESVMVRPSCLRRARKWRLQKEAAGRIGFPAALKVVKQVELTTFVPNWISVLLERVPRPDLEHAGVALNLCEVGPVNRGI